MTTEIDELVKLAEAAVEAESSDDLTATLAFAQAATPAAILAMSARIEELEGALKPFADEAKKYVPSDKPREYRGDNRITDESMFTVGELRRAHRALAETTKAESPPPLSE